MKRPQSVPLAFLLTSLLPSSLADFNTSCPALITNRNATGTVVFSDPITQGQNTDLSDDKQYTDKNSYLLSNDTTLTLASTNLSYTLGVSTASTVFNGKTLPAIMSSLSVSADGAELFNDEPTDGWAACALPILNLPDLATRYGQTDDGSCQQTLPHGCVDKILKRVLAKKFTFNPNSGLSQICAAYGDAITNSDLEPDGSDASSTKATLPQECTNLFRKDNKPGPLVAKVEGYPITSANESTPFSQFSTYQCPSIAPQLSGDSIKSYPFYNTTTQYNEDGTIAFGGSYDEAVRRVYPIITVFFRGTGATFFGYYPAVSATMSCVRVNEFSEGSRVTAPLEEVKPPSDGLSTGAKAGIAVVVVLVLLGAIGVLVAMWMKKKRNARGRKDYGQASWYQRPAQVFKRGGTGYKGMEKSEYELMAK